MTNAAAPAARSPPIAKHHTHTSLDTHVREPPRPSPARMLPTPDTSHVSFANVYEPAEDSYLLLDALSAPSETAWLHARFAHTPHAHTSPPLIVEIGPGSGVVLAFLAAHTATLLGRSDALTLGIDLNPLACAATRATLARNAPAAHFLGAVNGDLTAPLRGPCVDLLVFNPPYVPSEPLPPPPQPDALLKAGPGAALSRHDVFERDSRLLALATDGGADGMEVTDRLLAQLPGVLHEGRGVAYVLLCAQNRPDEVKRRVEAWGNGWAVATVRTSGRQGGWEKLQIVRIARIGR